MILARCRPFVASAGLPSFLRDEYPFERPVADSRGLPRASPTSPPRRARATTSRQAFLPVRQASVARRLCEPVRSQASNSPDGLPPFAMRGSVRLVRRRYGRARSSAAVVRDTAPDLRQPLLAGGYRVRTADPRNRDAVWLSLLRSPTEYSTHSSLEAHGFSAHPRDVALGPSPSASTGYPREGPLGQRYERCSAAIWSIASVSICFRVVTEAIVAVGKSCGRSSFPRREGR